MKKIPGANDYSIGLDCNLYYNDKLAEGYPSDIYENFDFELYGKVYKTNLDWLSHFAFYELDLPEPYNQNLTNILFVNRSPLFNKLKVKSIPKFLIPVEEDGYRMIPTFCKYGINQEGEVIEFVSKKLIKVFNPKDNKHYPSCSIYSPYLSRVYMGKIHHIKALAWIPNDNFFLRPVVNHKDGNKLNHELPNLEWCSVKENSRHAFLTGLMKCNKRCVLRNIETQEIIEFNSISDLANHLKTDYSKICKHLVRKNRLRPLLEQYEVKLDGDGTDWEITGEVVGNPSITIIKITTPDGTETKYFGIRDIVKQFKLWNPPTYQKDVIIGLFKEKNPDWDILIENEFVIHPIDVLDVKTMTVLTFDDCAKAGRHFNLHRTYILRKVERNDETLVYDGLAFRKHSDLPWNENLKEYKTLNCKIKLINTLTDEIKILNSIRETARFLNTDRTVVKVRLKTGKSFDNWLFEKAETSN